MRALHLIVNTLFSTSGRRAEGGGRFSNYCCVLAECEGLGGSQCEFNLARTDRQLLLNLQSSRYVLHHILMSKVPSPFSFVQRDCTPHWDPCTPAMLYFELNFPSKTQLTNSDDS